MGVNKPCCIPFNSWLDYGLVPLRGKELIKKLVRIPVSTTLYIVCIYIYAYMYSNIHMFVNLAFVFLDVLETFIETYL